MWRHPWHDRRLDEAVNRSSFSCKGREMSGLSREHSLLAHRGLISPTLRAASTVYYWRHTAAQERSRSAQHTTTFFLLCVDIPLWMSVHCTGKRPTFSGLPGAVFTVAKTSVFKF